MERDTEIQRLIQELEHILHSFDALGLDVAGVHLAQAIDFARSATREPVSDRFGLSE